MFIVMRFLPLLLVFALCLAGCMKDDDYTTSPSDRLAFSKDSIAFDTIISGSPTKTYSFTVYNHASKALRIPQVSLRGGASSPFKVNVDGVALDGGTASDFEIAAKDSMVGYLMANVPEQDSDLPTAFTDELVFVTEAGVQQSVKLTASGQDVLTLTGKRIAANETFAARRPYRVMDSLVVEQGQTLTLARGVTLLFHSNASLIVHGTLRIEGTADSLVTLRGDRLDYMFTNQPYDRTPGTWGGVTFTAESFGNTVQYADIHGGKYGLRLDSSDVAVEKLRMENSRLHTCTSHALDIRMAKAFVGNSLIANAGGDCLHVRGGDVSVVHCTVARFYVFTGGSGAALDFANYDGSSRLPLTNLYMANSIVTGYQDDELMGGQNVKYKDADAFNYSFVNCLINTPQPATDSEEYSRFVQCRWDQKSAFDTSQGQEACIREKNFTPDFDLTRLLFNFDLAERSQAVGAANAQLTQQYYPTDLLGRSRGNAPDAGCLQRQASPGGNQ